MTRLSYLTNTSLDGFIADAAGRFDLFPHDDDVFAFTTQAMRTYGTHLYGRKLYELMAVWETDPSFAAQSPLMAEFAHAWQDADKIVFSRTLTEPSTRRTRIVRDLDAQSLRDLLDSLEGDAFIGGAEVASLAFSADAIDTVELIIWPYLVGGGRRAFEHGMAQRLSRRDVRLFANDASYVRYDVIR